jgi:hypothetical protein
MKPDYGYNADEPMDRYTSWPTIFGKFLTFLDYTKKNHKTAFVPIHLSINRSAHWPKPVVQSTNNLKPKLL